VADASWGRFIQILTCKAESAGKWVVPVNPRGTSQRCSECGATVKKTLYERVHRCDCGYVADRDVNAARNVLALGRSVVMLAEESARLAHPHEVHAIIYSG
jgi:putative transposase